MRYRDEVEKKSGKVVSLLKLSALFFCNMIELLTLSPQKLKQQIALYGCYETRKDRVNWLISSDLSPVSLTQKASGRRCSSCIPLSAGVRNKTCPLNKERKGGRKSPSARWRTFRKMDAAAKDRKAARRGAALSP